MKAKFLLPILIVSFVMIASCKKGQIYNPGESMLSTADQKVVKFDVSLAAFSNPTMLTNIYLPYEVGTKYIFEGETEDGLERNEIQRIAAFKQVMGITVAVVQDKVWLNGILEEDTRDWFAQDDDGNVWYMGEDVDNYNPDGSIKDHAGAWEAGLNDAVAGIIMLAEPKSGVSYQQEFAAGIAEDKAKVVALGLTVEVPFNTYINCLKTKEWSDLERGAIDYKFYAPGVGLIKEKKRNATFELIGIE